MCRCVVHTLSAFYLCVCLYVWASKCRFQNFLSLSRCIIFPYLTSGVCPNHSIMTPRHLPVGVQLKTRDTWSFRSSWIICARPPLLQEFRRKLPEGATLALIMQTNLRLDSGGDGGRGSSSLRLSMSDRWSGAWETEINTSSSHSLARESDNWASTSGRD